MDYGRKSAQAALAEVQKPAEQREATVWVGERSAAWRQAREGGDWP